MNGIEEGTEVRLNRPNSVTGIVTAQSAFGLHSFVEWSNGYANWYDTETLIAL